MITYIINNWMENMNVTTTQFRDVSGYSLREIYRWQQGEMIPNKQSLINIVHTFARIGKWTDKRRDIAVRLMLALRKEDYVFRRNNRQNSSGYEKNYLTHRKYMNSRLLPSLEL